MFVDVICKSIPAEVYFIGIQPGQTGLGEPLSRQVDDSVKGLVDILARLFERG
jgi:hypothetical protein